MKLQQTFRRMIPVLSMLAILVFAVSAASAQDDGTSEPQPPNWQALPNGVTPPTLPNGTTPPALPDGVTPPEFPTDGKRPPLPPRWTSSTATTSVTCAPATRLDGETEGEVAQSYSSIREEIGSSTVLAVMPGGAVFEILDGPVCSGPHYWYQVSYNGVVGWVAEGNLSEYWLEPVNLD